MSNIALEAKTKEHKLLKSYLEANARECLIEKINNGVKIEKDGKTLINKKTLETFMAFATDTEPFILASPNTRISFAITPLQSRSPATIILHPYASICELHKKFSLTLMFLEYINFSA